MLESTIDSSVACLVHKECLHDIATRLALEHERQVPTVGCRGHCTAEDQCFRFRTGSFLSLLGCEPPPLTRCSIADFEVASYLSEGPVPTALRSFVGSHIPFSLCKAAALRTLQEENEKQPALRSENLFIIIP